MSEVRALVKHCVFHIIWPSDYLKFRCPEKKGGDGGVCVGMGGPRAWPCFGITAQTRRRGHFANVCFIIRVHLRRFVQAIEPFRGLPSPLQGAGTTQQYMVARGGQSDATNRCHGCHRNYQHRSPGARGWALSTHGYHVLRTMIYTLGPRHDMRYDGRFDILARNDAAHA